MNEIELEYISAPTKQELIDKINLYYNNLTSHLASKTETKGEIKLTGKLGKKLQGKVSTDKSTIKTEGTNPNPQEDSNCPF